MLNGNLIRKEVDCKSKDIKIIQANRNLRRVEIEAYASVINAFRAQGPLIEDKIDILEELCEQLAIPPERHYAELKRALNDDSLNQVARTVIGFDTSSSWEIEAAKYSQTLQSCIPKSRFVTNAFHALSNYCVGNILSSKRQEFKNFRAENGNHLHENSIELGEHAYCSKPNPLASILLNSMHHEDNNTTSNTSHSYLTPMGFDTIEKAPTPVTPQNPPPNPEESFDLHLLNTPNDPQPPRRKRNAFELKFHSEDSSPNSDRDQFPNNSKFTNIDSLLISNNSKKQKFEPDMTSHDKRRVGKGKTNIDLDLFPSDSLYGIVDSKTKNSSGNNFVPLISLKKIPVESSAKPIDTQRKPQNSNPSFKHLKKPIKRMKNRKMNSVQANNSKSGQQQPTAQTLEQLPVSTPETSSSTDRSTLARETSEQMKSKEESATSQNNHPPEANCVLTGNINTTTVGITTQSSALQATDVSNISSNNKIEDDDLELQNPIETGNMAHPGIISHLDTIEYVESQDMKNSIETLITAEELTTTLPLSEQILAPVNTQLSLTDLPTLPTSENEIYSNKDKTSLQGNPIPTTTIDPSTIVTTSTAIINTNTTTTTTPYSIDTMGIASSMSTVEPTPLTGIINTKTGPTDIEPVSSDNDIANISGTPAISESNIENIHLKKFPHNPNNDDNQIYSLVEISSNSMYTKELDPSKLNLTSDARSSELPSDNIENKNSSIPYRPPKTNLQTTKTPQVSQKTSPHVYSPISSSERSNCESSSDTTPLTTPTKFSKEALKTNNHPFKEAIAHNPFSPISSPEDHSDSPQITQQGDAHSFITTYTTTAPIAEDTYAYPTPVLNYQATSINSSENILTSQHSSFHPGTHSGITESLSDNIDTRVSLTYSNNLDEIGGDDCLSTSLLTPNSNTINRTYSKEDSVFVDKLMFSNAINSFIHQLMPEIDGKPIETSSNSCISPVLDTHESPFNLEDLLDFEHIGEGCVTIDELRELSASLIELEDVNIEPEDLTNEDLNSDL